jgi:hypothetical protein
MKFRDALINALMGDAWERMYDRLELLRQLFPPTTQEQADEQRRQVYGELADEILAAYGDQELQNRADKLAKIFKPRLEGSIYTQDTDREVLAFLKDAAMLKFKQ